jgi:hypothetical protein
VREYPLEDYVEARVQSTPLFGAYRPGRGVELLAEISRRRQRI